MMQPVQAETEAAKAWMPHGRLLLAAPLLLLLLLLLQRPALPGWLLLWCLWQPAQAWPAVDDGEHMCM